METGPLVTVLIPVRNGAATILSALRSIQKQTYRHLEILIIDDGSTDETQGLIEHAQKKDSRIRLEKNSESLGVARTLNRGMELARGEFIARMDADDYSSPRRIERQIAILKESPETGLVGSAMTVFGSVLPRIVRYPETKEAIGAVLFFNSAFSHPSILLRKSLFEKHGLKYNLDFERAEDYELWTRASSAFPCVNLKESLLFYRIHRKQVSLAHVTEQVDAAQKVRKSYFERLGISITPSDLKIHGWLCGTQIVRSETLSTKDLGDWCDRLGAAVRQTHPELLEDLSTEIGVRLQKAYYDNRFKDPGFSAELKRLKQFEAGKLSLLKRAHHLLKGLR